MTSELIFLISLVVFVLLFLPIDRGMGAGWTCMLVEIINFIKTKIGKEDKNETA